MIPKIFRNEFKFYTNEFEKFHRYVDLGLDASQEK